GSQCQWLKVPMTPTLRAFGAHTVNHVPPCAGCAPMTSNWRWWWLALRASPPVPSRCCAAPLCVVSVADMCGVASLCLLNGQFCSSQRGRHEGCADQGAYAVSYKCGGCMSVSAHLLRADVELPARQC